MFLFVTNYFKSKLEKNKEIMFSFNFCQLLMSQISKICKLIPKQRQKQEAIIRDLSGFLSSYFKLVLYSQQMVFNEQKILGVFWNCSTQKRNVKFQLRFLTWNTIIQNTNFLEIFQKTNWVCWNFSSLVNILKSKKQKKPCKWNRRHKSKMDFFTKLPRCCLKLKL